MQNEYHISTSTAVNTRKISNKRYSITGGKVVIFSTNLDREICLAIAADLRDSLLKSLEFLITDQNLKLLSCLAEELSRIGKNDIKITLDCPDKQFNVSKQDFTTSLTSFMKLKPIYFYYRTQCIFRSVFRKELVAILMQLQRSTSKIRYIRVFENNYANATFKKNEAEVYQWSGQISTTFFRRYNEYINLANRYSFDGRGISLRDLLTLEARRVGMCKVKVSDLPTSALFRKFHNAKITFTNFRKKQLKSPLMLVATREKTKLFDASGISDFPGALTILQVKIILTHLERNRFNRMMLTDSTRAGINVGIDTRIRIRDELRATTPNELEALYELRAISNKLSANPNALRRLIPNELRSNNNAFRKALPTSFLNVEQGGVQNLNLNSRAGLLSYCSSLGYFMQMRYF